MSVKRIIAQRLACHVNMINTPITQIRQKSSLLSQKSLNDYEEAVPKFLDNLPSSSFPAEVMEKVKKISEYSIREKQNIAGPLTIHAYETLANPDNRNIISLNDIRILGWGADMVHSYFKILNDMEDYPRGYRRQHYWDHYDASLIRSSVYKVLANYFDKNLVYRDLVDVFNKAFLFTEIGNTIHPRKYQRGQNFTITEYNSTTDYKTYHMFHIPVQLAMKLTAINDESSYNAVNTILRDIGRLYQMQSDYLDCYKEDPEQPGLPTHSKAIQHGRRTWLLLSAMQRCDSAKKVVLTSCYGSAEPAHIERVKLLYDQLDIPKIYKEEEQIMLESLNKNIVMKLAGTKLPSALFMNVVDFIKERGQ